MVAGRMGSRVTRFMTAAPTSMGIRAGTLRVLGAGARSARVALDGLQLTPAAVPRRAGMEETRPRVRRGVRAPAPLPEPTAAAEMYEVFHRAVALVLAAVGSMAAEVAGSTVEAAEVADAAAVAGAANGRTESPEG